ncbi:hypothetical protein PR048_014899 [Dryococelus australis]|uniref:DDE-1 domain-containing protein n=1 Tax=Dryococelus australis TaxID=614101 RepID=A0ABQ9HFP2_9NEOP|nr:hypothetical protein PR048_014899 [Dryococelus australis]
MPRVYVKKKRQISYTLGQVKTAVKAVIEKKMTCRKQKKFLKPVLPEEVEKEIENCILAKAEWGYSVDRVELLELVQEYVKCNNLSTPFKDGKPGEDRHLSFMKRHSNLSLKKPELLQQKISDACDPFVVHDFYEKLAASGDVLSLLIIFKAKGTVQARWTNRELEYPGTVYSTTENGYMEESVFFSWLNKLLILCVESVCKNKNIPNKKVVLIMDAGWT